MTRASWILLPFIALTQGCIIYENNGDGWCCGDEDYYWYDTGTDTAEVEDPDTDTNGDTDVEDTSSGLVITPDHAEPGDIVIVNITNVVEFDLTIIVNVWFDSAIVVHDVIVRDGEVSVVVEVPTDTAHGSSTMYVGTENGDVLTVDVPFVVGEFPEDPGCE